MSDQPEVKSLNEKIFDIQSEIGAISKESTNPFFKSKYFDVNTLIAQLQTYLIASRVVLTQPIREGYVYSVISDLDSDDSISSSLKLPDLADPQKIGSCITYYRRYTLASLLALQAEDDDGNKGAGNSKPQARQVNNKKNDDNKPWLKLGTPEFENCLKAMREGKTIKDIRDHYKVNTPEAKALEDGNN